MKKIGVQESYQLRNCLSLGYDDDNDDELFLWYGWLTKDT